MQNRLLASQEQMRKDALEAAKHEVQGFILHDNKKYLEGAIHFSLAYQIINRHRINPVSEENALLAGVHKMGVLKAYDGIVDNPEIKTNFTHPSVQNHPNFKRMLYHALEECRKFALPENYSKSKLEWYMQHADWVKGFTGKIPADFPFLDKLKDGEKLFVTAITGDATLFERAWPIYLSCVLLHDIPRVMGSFLHDEMNIASMTEAYSTYLIILFQQGKL